MILISYGLPKSASTFVFFTLTNLAEGAGSPIWRRLDERMPADRKAAFQPDVDREYIELARDRWPDDELLPVKTHSTLHAYTAQEIWAGRIKATASFRDPRDSALALLDAGVRDRENGKESFFATLHHMDDAIRVLRKQIGKTMEWLETPNVMPVPFMLVAQHPDILARELANFAGTEDALSRIDEAAPKKEDVPEFNKGVLKRYETEMDPKHRAEIEDRFGFYIERFDAITNEVFRNLGLPEPV